METYQESVKINAKNVYIGKKYKFEKCCHCGDEIYIKKKSLHKLYKKKVYRRCSAFEPVYEGRCDFIICGVCAGDFTVFADNYMDTGCILYTWSGNSWLGIPPREVREVRDDDYVCCPECPGLKK